MQQLGGTYVRSRRTPMLLSNEPILFSTNRPLRVSRFVFESRCFAKHIILESNKLRSLEVMCLDSWSTCRQAPHQLRTRAVRTEVPIKVPLYLHHKGVRYVPAF